jgi:mRNA interferase MazF
VIRRGSVWWADLGPPQGSRPAKVRPVLVIQDNSFNDSGVHTTLVAAITSNTRLAAMPGNVFLPAASSGLPRDSVVNVTSLVTLNKSDLRDEAGHLPAALMREVDRGLRMVLCLRREHESFQEKSFDLRPEVTATPELSSGAQEGNQTGRERAAADRGRRARRERSAAVVAARADRESRRR